MPPLSLSLSQNPTNLPKKWTPTNSHKNNKINHKLLSEPNHDTNDCIAFFFFFFIFFFFQWNCQSLLKRKIQLKPSDSNNMISAKANPDILRFSYWTVDKPLISQRTWQPPFIQNKSILTITSRSIGTTCSFQVV